MAREGGFLYELRRRHVVRVAIAYAIAAWVLLQLASIVFPAFGAPEWVLKVVIAMIALGFPPGAGIKDEAIAEGRRAVELLPLSRDAFACTEYLQHLAHIYAVIGEKDQAIAELQHLLSVPGGLSLSRAMLRVDRTWDPLRDDPRFRALLKDPS